MNKEGWTTMRFDEFAERVNETVMPAESDLERYIGLEHLDTMDLKIRRWDEGRNLVGQKLVVRKGDIIIARRNWYLRRVAIAPFDALCSAHAMIVRPKKDVGNPEFLPYFLLSEQFFQKANSISVGSLSPTINWSSLRKVEFSIPSISRQEKLIGLYRSMLEEYSSISLVLEKIKSYSEMISTAVFIKDGSIDTKYGKFPIDSERVSLGDIADISLGITLNEAKNKHLEIEYPYIRVENVGRNHINLDELKYTKCPQKMFQKNRLTYGDVLLVEGHADRNEIGRAALWKDDMQDITHQNHVFRIRAKQDILPEFILYWINSKFSKRYFFSVAQSSSGLNTINSKAVSNLPFPLFPIETQQRILEILQAYNTAILQTEKSAENALNLLRKSIRVGIDEGGIV